jgi:hypothetical protein
MGKSRQIILIKAVDPKKGGGDGGLEPLGSQRAVTEILAKYNTAPDGAPARTGLIALHGPGLVAEMPTADDEVRQVMVTMTDEDFAFPVLLRLCRERLWTMMDPESGRRFGP